MVLGNGQYYTVSLAEEKFSIQLSIILLPNTEHSAELRKDLLQYFMSKLDLVVEDFMSAAKKPIAYIPCCFCNQLHLRLSLLLQGKQQHCPIKNKPLLLKYYRTLVSDEGKYLFMYSLHVFLFLAILTKLNIQLSLTNYVYCLCTT